MTRVGRGALRRRRARAGMPGSCVFAWFLRYFCGWRGHQRGRWPAEEMGRWHVQAYTPARGRRAKHRPGGDGSWLVICTSAPASRLTTSPTIHKVETCPCRAPSLILNIKLTTYKVKHCRVCVCTRFVSALRAMPCGSRSTHGALPVSPSLRHGTPGGAPPRSGTWARRRG